jgi:hypothetical protein
MTAAQFYDAVERGDYCELIWVDGRKQVKVAGAMLAAGDPKPILIVGTRGEVLYRLAADDRAVILVRRATA